MKKSKVKNIIAEIEILKFELRLMRRYKILNT